MTGKVQRGFVLNHERVRHEADQLLTIADRMTSARSIAKQGFLSRSLVFDVEQVFGLQPSALGRPSDYVIGLFFALNTLNEAIKLNRAKMTFEYSTTQPRFFSMER